MYYTYVLRSEMDGKLYVGWSKDLKNRLREHNDGRVFATKARRPFVLVYYEACLNEESAVAREKQLKTGYGRRYLKSRL
jgi:putative endonuclease